MWDFLGMCYMLRNRKETWSFSKNKNCLRTHQRYADFQTACVLRSTLEHVPKILFARGRSAQKTRFILFIYIYYVSQLYNFNFENNCKTFICNVMVVLLYLLCTLELILNMDSTPEMFPPSVFGVWQICIVRTSFLHLL